MWALHHYSLLLIVAILGVMGVFEILTSCVGKATLLVEALAILIEAIRKLW